MACFRSRQLAPRARDAGLKRTTALASPASVYPRPALPGAPAKRVLEPWGGPPGALLHHNSSCSSSSEPEGPWRTSSYHLLVRVFIWMRPWWRSWVGDTSEPSSVGLGRVTVRAEEVGEGNCFVPHGGCGRDGRQGTWPRAISKS